MTHRVARMGRARTLLQVMTGLLVVLLALGGLSAPAFAAGGKVTILPVDGGGNYNGTPVLVEGQSYPFQIGYGSMDDGAVVAVQLPEGVTIPQGALAVPAGNTAVQSLAVNEQGELVITFADPFPGDVSQGYLDLQLTFTDVETTGSRDLVWSAGGESTTQRVIVTKPGEQPQATGTGSNKSTSRGSLPHSIVDGRVVIDESVIGTEIPYTVTVSSTNARSVTLTDTLGTGLTYVANSLTGSKVVRDADGLHPQTTPVTSLPAISGSSFTTTFDAEANSVYTFQYRATITDADALEAIREELQAKYDAINPVNGGGYSVSLKNTVDVNGQQHSATTSFSGNRAGLTKPGTGTAFSKSVDTTAAQLGATQAAGTEIAGGINVTYTLGADLTVFANVSDPSFALTRNVVVRDPLPAQAAWNLDDADFLTVVDQNGDAVAFTRATDVTGNLEVEMAADAYVHQYFIDGNTLYLNLGKDTSKKYTVTAHATITDLPGSTSAQNQYESQYRVQNNAYFVFGTDSSWKKYEGKDATTTITVPKDTTGGVDDSSKFSKRVQSATTSVTPGGIAQIPFTFSVGNNVGDAAHSRIIDAIDHDVFDVTAETLDQIRASITGRYDSNYPLDGSTFDLTIDEAGNLIITPNEAFPLDAAWGGAEGPFTKAWNIEVTLPTHALDGKQTLEITNNARYEGASSEIVYTSTSSAEATSFGNEMEVRKRVYDATTDSYTTNLRVDTDANGDLVQSDFVYRVELMPHGSFTTMVEDVVDVLPEGVEFVGFVAPGDVANGTVAANDTYRIPDSNITATYNAENESVTLQKGKLTSGQTVSLYFKVHVTDFAANVGITNVIGSTSATITPSDGYPLDLVKRDSTDAEAVLSDDDARFSVLADDETTVVLNDLRLVDGRIVAADGTSPLVKQPGTYWLREDVAPAGYVLSDELRRITVAADGSSEQVALPNTPEPVVEPERTYAVGDVVWIDANRNGQQDSDEQVLPGVTVELIRDGEVIATTTTDDRGRYLFDELPAGEYQVQFTLTPEQAKIYSFTRQDAGDDDAIDSDADPFTGRTGIIVLGPDNSRLTHEYEWADVRATEGIDPTWDAGVVVNSTTNEGDSDSDSTGRGPDADAGADATGAGADSDASADANGADASADAGAAAASGASADASSTGATAAANSVTGSGDPAHPGTPGVNDLARTGGAGQFGWIAGALALLLAGGVLLLRKRRTA